MPKRFNGRKKRKRLNSLPVINVKNNRNKGDIFITVINRMDRSKLSIKPLVREKKVSLLKELFIRAIKAIPLLGGLF